MGFFDMICNNKIINKKAKLLIDIKLENGECRNKNDIVSVLLDKGNGKYHVEDNKFSCTVSGNEIEFINVEEEQENE